MDFRTETVADLARRVRMQEVSARELVQGALDRIAQVDDRVHAFVAIDPEAALTAASEIDVRVARGEDVGPLAGIPIGVKDLEDAAGVRTTHGSIVYADAPPADADSVLVTRLKSAGCVVIGKTNTPEFGHKADTVNALFPATCNPWNFERTPGGSSGGSAAAIASGMVPMATGSDGGGSIRIPSALCGLSGFKPSLGRVPSGGSHAPDWHHLSTKGVMAARVADIALGLDAVIGPDPTDLRSMPMPDPAWVSAVAEPHVPMRVAWSPTLGYAPLDDEVRAMCESAVKQLEQLGAIVTVVEDVFDKDPVGPWLTLTSAYNLRSLEPVRGTEKWSSVDPMLAMVAESATTRTAVDMVKAEDECHQLNLRLVELFKEVRLLVTPTTAAVAPRINEPGTINGATDVNWVRYTYPFNLTRSPAGTVCVGVSSAGVPVGLQLIGPQHGDLVVLRTMAALEDAIDFDDVALL